MPRADADCERCGSTLIRGLHFQGGLGCCPMTACHVGLVCERCERQWTVFCGGGPRCPGSSSDEPEVA